MMRSLETDLFELVFEGLDQWASAALVRALLGHDVALPTGLDGLREVALESLALRPGVVLMDVHVRWLCYDGSVYDVEVNFRPSQAKAPSKEELVAALCDFAAELAEANGISTYFAGLEPASDQETRLFTGKAKGPYYRLV